MTGFQRTLWAVSVLALIAGAVVQFVSFDYHYSMGGVLFVVSLWSLQFVTSDMLADRIQGDSDD